MKISYLLESYDEMIRLVNSPPNTSQKEVFQLLSNNEANSYRIYKITIINNEGNDTIMVSTPIHSFHPKVKKLELKTVFKFNEFEKYIPLLKKHINFTDEVILFANDPCLNNTFYVYEKCTIMDLKPNEKRFLYCH